MPYNLCDLLSDFLQNHSRPRKRTFHRDQRMAQRILADIGNPPVQKLTVAALRTWHASTGEKHGHYEANRQLALLRAAINKCDDWDQPNPARRVTPFAEQQRDRFLSAAELERLNIALDSPATKRGYADFIHLSLFCGARKSNTAAMRWDQLDLDAATWRIPPEASKNGRTMLIPLCPQALSILAHRRGLFPDSPWVFPGRSTSGHMIDRRCAWRDLLRRAELADFRIHDLRRTLGSYMAIGGASLPIIGKALGHQSQQTTQIYARLSLAPVRAGIAAATDAMMGTPKPPEPPKQYFMRYAG